MPLPRAENMVALGELFLKKDLNQTLHCQMTIQRQVSYAEKSVRLT